MKLQHAGKISRLQEKMDKEQAQLENARKELDSIQKQLEMHLTDKQSLNDELDEMKRLLGINDNDDLSSVISEFSRERSVKAVLSRSSSTSSSRSASKNITAEKISLDASMKSNNPSLRIQREVNQAAENQAAPVNAPLGSSSSRASVNLKKANSRRTITFTRHENGGPTIVAKPDSVDMDPILINLKKLLKQTPKKADLKIAELLVQLTTKQRHKLERLYDDSNPKKPLRSLFDDKKRKSKPGFNKTIQLLLASDTERDALNIHQAMKKKNYQLIIEILVTRHSIHTRHIRQVYEKLFHKELKDQIEKTFTDQRLCILLLGLLFKERNANNVVDLMPVNKDLRRGSQISLFSSYSLIF